jgi:hypothetical protein
MIVARQPSTRLHARHVVALGEEALALPSDAAECPLESPFCRGRGEAQCVGGLLPAVVLDQAVPEERVDRLRLGTERLLQHLQEDIDALAPFARIPAPLHVDELAEGTHLPLPQVFAQPIHRGVPSDGAAPGEEYVIGAGAAGMDFRGDPHQRFLSHLFGRAIADPREPGTARSDNVDMHLRKQALQRAIAPAPGGRGELDEAETWRWVWHSTGARDPAPTGAASERGVPAPPRSETE